MSQDSTPTTSWDAVATELRAYRDLQQQTWGNLDHALIGRYLAGEVSVEERAQVETALADHPELRMLTEVVSGVLADVEPPQVLSFPAPSRRKGRQSRLRQLSGLAAAASLLLGLGFALNPSERLSSGEDADDLSRVDMGGSSLGAMASSPRALDELPLPEGCVNVGVEVTAAPATSPSIAPGDKVDVLFSEQGTADRRKPRVILRDVLVTSVNARVENRRSGPPASPYLNLAVNAKDANLIHLTNPDTQTYFALRRESVSDAKSRKGIVKGDHHRSFAGATHSDSRSPTWEVQPQYHERARTLAKPGSVPPLVPKLVPHREPLRKPSHSPREKVQPSKGKD